MDLCPKLGMETIKENFQKEMAYKPNGSWRTFQTESMDGESLEMKDSVCTQKSQLSAPSKGLLWLI